MAKNVHLSGITGDFLYHLGLETSTAAVFSDVKFVCMGGSAKRMLSFSQLLKEQLNCSDPIVDLTGHADRYSMYKVGPVLALNHGIGISSLLVVLNEIIKLLHYARCSDVTIIRIGTSGGIGVEPGTVVLTNSAVDEYLNPFFEMAIVGEKVRRPSVFDQQLVEQLHNIGSTKFKFPIIKGKTMSATDFYESQGRLDGAICNHTEEDKMCYLRKLADAGVVNIEMEAVALGAILTECQLKGTAICVTLLDRLRGDQVRMSKEEKVDFEMRPQLLTCEFIKNQISKWQNSKMGI